LSEANRIATTERCESAPITASAQTLFESKTGFNKKRPPEGGLF